VKGTLYVVGAICELFGILVIASPDWFPHVVRFAEWLRPRVRAVENRVRRFLRLRPHVVTHQVAAAGEISLAGRLTSRTSISDAASHEQKVAYLLRRDAETQERLGVLERRADAVERDLPQRLAQLRGELEAHVAGEVGAAASTYRATRIVGAIALTLGLALTTAGSFA